MPCFSDTSVDFLSHDIYSRYNFNLILLYTVNSTFSLLSNLLVVSVLFYQLYLSVRILLVKVDSYPEHEQAAGDYLAYLHKLWMSPTTYSNVHPSAHTYG